MKNSKFSQFSMYQLEDDVMKHLIGGRCPKSLAGDPLKCKDYWGSDTQGADACQATCSETY